MLHLVRQTTEVSYGQSLRLEALVGEFDHLMLGEAVHHTLTPWPQILSSVNLPLAALVKTRNVLDLGLLYTNQKSALREKGDQWLIEAEARREIAESKL